MSSCKDKDPTLTPEWFEALISTPAPPPPSPPEYTPKSKDDFTCVCVACESGKAKGVIQ